MLLRPSLALAVSGGATCLVVVLFAAAGWLSPRVALAQGCNVPSITVAPTLIRAGETATLSAGGFSPGTTATYFLVGPSTSGASTAPVNSACQIRLPLPTQANQPPGAYTIRLVGTKANGGLADLSATLVVLPGDSPSAGPRPAAPELSLGLLASAMAVPVGSEVTFTALANRQLLWRECAGYVYQAGPAGESTITGFARTANGYTLIVRRDLPGLVPVSACIADEDGKPARSSVVTVIWVEGGPSQPAPGPASAVPVLPETPGIQPIPPVESRAPLAASCQAPALAVTSAVGDDVLEGDRPLRVKVVDSGGRPLPGVVVAAGPERVVTDEAGEAPFSYTFSVLSADRQTWQQTFTTEGCAPEGSTALAFSAAVLGGGIARTLDDVQARLLQQVISLGSGQRTPEAVLGEVEPTAVPMLAEVMQTFLPAANLLAGGYRPEAEDLVFQAWWVISWDVSPDLIYHYAFVAARQGTPVYWRYLWSRDPAKLPPPVP